MLRSVALAFAVAVGLLAAPAMAQQVSPFDGFYAGGHIGYGWGTREGCVSIGSFPAPQTCEKQEYNQPEVVQICEVSTFGEGGGCCQQMYTFGEGGCEHRSHDFPFSYNQSGWLAGGQIGLNLVRGGLLVGGEVSASLTGIRGILDKGDFSGIGNYPWLATATFKVGVTTGPALLYLEGGLGLGGFHFASPLCNFDTVNSGPLYGAGAELIVSPRNSIFLEWNRFAFEPQDNTCSFQKYGKTVPVGVYTKPQLDVVKFGFNHFFQ